MLRPSKPAAWHDRRWTIVVLLLLVVLVPSATVLWLTAAAVRNERAAVRQRLLDAYEGRLQLAASQLDEHWRSVQRECSELSELESGPALFKICVESGLADSVLVFESDGKPAYPAPAIPSDEVTLNPDAWAVANRLEFVDCAFIDAAEAYAAIAHAESSRSLEARAWMAHARCFEQAGMRDEAVRALTDEMDRPELRSAVDHDGRRLWLDAQLRALELALDADAQPHEIAARRNRLRQTLDDYTNSVSSAQRLFAMRRFKQLFPEAADFATFSAEQLAATQLGYDVQPLSSRENTLERNGEIWRLTPREVPIVLLFDHESLSRRLDGLVAAWRTEDACISVATTESDAANSSSLATLSPETMPGWNVSLDLQNPELLDDASRQQAALYLVAGLLTITVVGLGTVTIAFSVRRQLKLAQLKNDLAAVVTHELRTPLASIRVLVDTLIDCGAADKQQTADYLTMIARENERLSRLIDNFLTFSRLDRQIQRFDFETADPTEVVERAVAAINGKLSDTNCNFETQFAAKLPSIQVDQDAIVTVLLNLLDNAMKFTGDDKRITLRVSEEDRFVRFEVEDNGVGMSPADVRRVFHQFFQADTSLSRNHGGCGLGLSLVHSIVEAHGGSVGVVSTLGSGSTFTVRLPVPTETAEGCPK